MTDVGTRSRRGAIVVALATVLSWAALSAPALARPGGLDPSWGNGGVATAALSAGGDYQNGLVVLPDESAVVGGSADMPAEAGGHNFVVLKFTKRGVFDSRFGVAGVASASLAPADVDAPLGIAEHAYRIAVQPDGGIVAAGFASAGIGHGGVDFGVARFTALGTLDPSFGGDGMVTIAIGAGDALDAGQALALQADGKILVGGVTEPDPNDPASNDFAVARLNADGTLDQTFGDGGRVVSDLHGRDTITELAVQADGAIVAAGQSCPGDATTCEFVVARYTSAGVLDPTFGNGGTVMTDVVPGRFDTAWTMTLQPDGKIVAAGTADLPRGAGRNDFALVRYDTDGSLDSGFGGDGIVTVAVGAGDARDNAFGVAVDALGRIVAGGSSGSGYTDSDFALARLLPDGSLDASFGFGGTIRTGVAPGANYDSMYAIAVTPTGKLVGSGECDHPDSGTDICVVRYKGGD